MKTLKLLKMVMVVALVLGSAGVCLADEVVPIKEPFKRTVSEDILIVRGITLTTGWNLVAIPVIPQEPLTVEKFMKLVEQSSTIEIPDHIMRNGDNFISISPPMWSVVVVAVYKNGKFKTYPREGVTYNMVPGEAYFVYAEYIGGPTYNGDREFVRPSITIKIDGKAANESVSLDLNRGWNGASLMRNDFIRKFDSQQVSLGNTLSQLSKELVEQQVKATRIAFWNAYRQEWELYDLPVNGKTPFDLSRLDPAYWDVNCDRTIDAEEVLHFKQYLEQYFPEVAGLTTDISGDGIVDVSDFRLFCEYVKRNFDRLIGHEEGFFLLCDENGLYIPALKVGKPGIEPPLPPMPPEPGRVSYIGVVERVMHVDGYTIPYDFVLITDSNERIPLIAANKNIDDALETAFASPAYLVEGVMKTIYYNQPYPTFIQDSVSVLEVDAIYSYNIIDHRTY